MTYRLNSLYIFVELNKKFKYIYNLLTNKLIEDKYAKNKITVRTY